MSENGVADIHSSWWENPVRRQKRAQCIFLRRTEQEEAPWRQAQDFLLYLFTIYYVFI